MTRSSLLRAQAPSGHIDSSLLRRVTDPIAINPSTDERLRHFFEGIYNLAPESHLSRFLKALLGDSGVGHLSNTYMYARAQSMLATMRFADLDAFYGAVFGLRRMTWERTDPALYDMPNTSGIWDEIDARDASYRARIEAFSRAIALGGTPNGLVGVAEAVLGVECRLYESYIVIDESGENTPPEAPVGGRTYGQVEEDFPTYAHFAGMTYQDVEGGYGQIGRTDMNDRNHFTIRPMRRISQEEAYTLTRVLETFKPVHSLMSIDPDGVALHSPMQMRGVASDSTYWEVLTSVSPSNRQRRLYIPPGADGDTHPEDDQDYQQRFDITRVATGGYQGEVWSYNSDIIRARGYREIKESLWPTLPDPEDYESRVIPPEGWQPVRSETMGTWTNYERVNYSTGFREYHSAKGLSDHGVILLGRGASDGVQVRQPGTFGSSVVGGSGGRGPMPLIVRPGGSHWTGDEGGRIGGPGDSSSINKIVGHESRVGWSMAGAGE